jgi:hypothetical protein
MDCLTNRQQTHIQNSARIVKLFNTTGNAIMV